MALVPEKEEHFVPGEGGVCCELAVQALRRRASSESYSKAATRADRALRLFDKLVSSSMKQG